jgi:hypothetical protein
MRTALMLLLVVATAETAGGDQLRAPNESVQSMVLALEGDDNTHKYGFAQGYLWGVFDSAHQLVLVCPPAGFITSGQLKQIFLNAAKKRPERWTDGTTWKFTTDALIEVWPCKGGASKP